MFEELALYLLICSNSYLRFTCRKARRIWTCFYFLFKPTLLDNFIFFSMRYYSYFIKKNQFFFISQKKVHKS